MPGFDELNPRYRENGSLAKWWAEKNKWYWDNATPQEREQWEAWRRTRGTAFVQNNFFNWVEKLRAGELGGNWVSDYRPPSTRPTPIPLERPRPTPIPLPTEPVIPPPPPPENPPAVATGSPGNAGNPISITYKFSDPNRPSTGQQTANNRQPTATQRPPALINPLPSQAPTPAPTGINSTRYDRDWRRGLLNRRPQNQSGFTNWLTRPASPPSRFNTFGVRSDRWSQWRRPTTPMGVGGGY